MSSSRGSGVPNGVISSTPLPGPFSAKTGVVSASCPSAINSWMAAAVKGFVQLAIRISAFAGSGSVFVRFLHP